MKSFVKILLVMLLTLILICNFNVSAYAINEVIENNSEKSNIQSEEKEKTESNNIAGKEENAIINETENNTTNNVLNNITTNETTTNTSVEMQNEINNEIMESRSISTYSTEKTKDNGIYKIAVGKDSSKTIEIAGSSTENNAKVDIWNYGNAAAQKFYLSYDEEGFYKITAMHTGKSLTVKENNIKEGTEIVQSEYKGLDSQKWILRDSGKNGWVISLLSNPQLSISVKGSIKNGAILTLSKTQDNDSQMFYMYNITADEGKKDNGIYKIAIGKDSSKAIEIAGSSTENNAKIDIWNYGNATAQKFYLNYDKEGFYKITAMHTGKSLTVKENKLTEGTEIVQSEYKGLDSQKWILRDSGKNGWVISLLSNPQLSISVKGSIKNGAILILSKTQDNDRQMFYMYNITADEGKKDNGIYKIAVGADSSKTIEIAGSDTGNNAKVDIWNYGNVPAQKFYLSYDKEGFYKITAISKRK